MKTTSLFQLGGIAVLLSTILIGIGNIMYFVSPELPPTTVGHWLGIASSTLIVFGLCALFARQAQRGGILGLIGFVLLVLTHIADVASDAVGLGVAAGVISNAQVAQVPVSASFEAVIIWIFAVSQMLFGISIYRAQVFPKYAGALLAIVGFIEPLTGLLVFTQPVYAILSFVAWAWLGFLLLTDKSVVSRQLAPAT